MMRSLTLLFGLALLVVSCGRARSAEAIRIGGSGAGLGLVRMLGEAYSQKAPGVRIDIAPSLGSSGGISAVAAGAIDIAISGRALNAKEASPKLRQQSFVDSPFLFVTSHPAPPALGLGSILKLYRGENSAWPDGSPLRLVLRPKSDAASLFMAARIEGMGQALDLARARPEVPVAPTDQDNLEMAERLRGSLATMTLVQISTEPNKLQPIRLDGYGPVLAGELNADYPFRYRLFLIVPAEASSVSQAFLGFLQTEPAHALIRKHGGIPLTAE